mgnify:CR=1 FL=1
METGSDPDLQILAQMRFIEDLYPIIYTGTRTAVIVHPIERIAEIQPVTVLVTTGILTVIIRHHIRTAEKPVMNADIPFLDPQIQFTTTREHIMTDKNPIMLHSLKPAQTHCKLLKSETISKIKFHEWIQEHIIDHSPCLL